MKSTCLCFLFERYVLTLLQPALELCEKTVIKPAGIWQCHTVTFILRPTSVRRPYKQHPKHPRAVAQPLASHQDRFPFS